MGSQFPLYHNLKCEKVTGMTKDENNLDCLACSDIADSIVKFDESGDGLARYTIYNYQKNSHNNGYDYKVKGIFKVVSHTILV